MSDPAASAPMFQATCRSPDGTGWRLSASGCETPRRTTRSGINSNGTGLRHLTRDTTYEDDSPAWSVRNRIAFVRTRIPTRAEIYMMNPDGSGQTPLTHGGHGFSQPAWSPDGRQIAFAAAVGHSNAIGSPMVIEVANADGTGARTVSPPAWASYNPVWTPGGKLVFLAQQGTRTNAYVITPDGTGLRLLYPGQAITLGSQIAWGPAALPPARC